MEEFTATQLVWILVGLVGALIIMNVLIIVKLKKKQKEEALPNLHQYDKAAAEGNLRKVLQEDINKKKARILDIKKQAKAMEKEMLDLQAEVDGLEATAGGVL
jgi:hypothetical protein